MLRDAKRSAMGKSKNQPLTPRRRALLSQTGAVNKITKSLPRPLSSVAAPACNVKVIVRVRPSNNKESEDNSYTAIKVLDDETLIFDPKEAEDPFFYHGVRQKRRDLLKKVRKDITFTFDRVFSPLSSNMEVFSGSTKNLIDTLMEGCNCSVFAYGATGAGKTYTMIGNIDEPGITYLTMKELFARKEQLSAERDFKLMVTYIEVYNELVKDLLNPGRPLELREDAKYGVMIPDVKGFPINSPEDMFKLLEQGNRRRTQHPTDANAESSRSHAVFQVYIQMTTKASGKSSRAKLSMIDLAGSERGSATGFVGARFKEGANINKSLLALGNCINSLADGHRHVPYRDSKLTRLLKDSLGGNCCTIMIANVSPSSLSYEDTYNTLRYATRAKKIKSTVKRNVVIPDRNVDQCIKVIEDLQNENTNLKREIEQLRAELAEARAGTLQNIPEIVVKAPVEPESTVSLPPQPSPVVAATEPSTDVSASQALRDLVLEKKDLMERVFQLQCSGLGIILRRGQKMTTEARLSVMYVDTPRKDDARRKLHQQLERYERRERCTNLEIEENCRKLRMIDDRIQELLGAHVELKDQWRECSMEIQCIEFKYERDLARREARILKDVCHGHEVLLEDMAKFMAPLFMAVGGVDDAPERLKRQYSNLVATFEGKQSLRWTDDDNIPEVDSGLSSLTSVCEDENTRPSKRTIENGSQVSLNSTFNLPQVTPSSSSGAPSTFGGPSGANIVAKGKKLMVKQASSPRPTYATHTYKTPPRAPTPRKPKPTSLRSATKNKTALEKDRRRWL